MRDCPAIYNNNPRKSFSGVIALKTKYLKNAFKHFFRTFAFSFYRLAVGRVKKNCRTCGYCCPRCKSKQKFHCFSSFPMPTNTQAKVLYFYDYIFSAYCGFICTYLFFFVQKIFPVGNSGRFPCFAVPQKVFSAPEP